MTEVAPNNRNEDRTITAVYLQGIFDLKELLTIEHPRLKEHRDAARQELRSPLGSKKLKNTAVNFLLIDANAN